MLKKLVKHKEQCCERAIVEPIEKLGIDLEN